MLFLTPNQQCQSTKRTHHSLNVSLHYLVKYWAPSDRQWPMARLTCHPVCQESSVRGVERDGLRLELRESEQRDDDHGNDDGGFMTTNVNAQRDSETHSVNSRTTHHGHQLHIHSTTPVPRTTATNAMIHRRIS